MNMNPAILQQIQQRLNRDYEFKKRGEWYQQGKCPSCGKRELFARADAPWIIKCNRLNKCDYSEHIKSLYPDLFEKWSDNYPTTIENPNAAADAYLRDARGFDIGRLMGLYTQESYFDAEKNIGSATVRFTIDATAKWERIIDEPERFGKQKGRALGSFKGKWWTGNQDIVNAEEIWVTEGIFNAIALWHVGIVAVSNISSSHFPHAAINALLAERLAIGKSAPRIIWALDADPAGKKATHKHIAQCNERNIPTAAAQPVDGKDWNDMLMHAQLNDSSIDDSRYRGNLLTADSAATKGNLMWSRNGYNQFHFAYDNRLYWFELDFAKYDKIYTAIENHQETINKIEDHETIKNKALMDSAAITEICTCYPQALYFLRNDITDESYYYFKISHPSGRVTKSRITAAAISGASDFKKRLISVSAGAIFTGNSYQLDSLMKSQLKNPTTVETIDYLGYDKAHDVYVFNDFAVSNDKIIEINSEDYFEINKKYNVKPLLQLPISINRDKKEYNELWMHHLYNAFGNKGIVALVYWVGTLFAEQIRHHNASFPFLEVVGEPNAGKSTLLNFLWKLLGQNNEGENPNNLTKAAMSRYFNQVSNLPVCLIESDSEDAKGSKYKQFNFDELKNLYNGGSFKGRGMKNNGNEIYSPDFKGAIVISQNSPVVASEPILQRICHLYFTCENRTPETKASAEYIERLEIEQVSYFLIKILTNQKAIIETYRNQFKSHDIFLSAMKEIKVSRIIKCHAQLLALLDAIKDLIGLSAEQCAAVREEIIEMAKTRQTAVSRDNPLVAEFFETIEHFKANQGSHVSNMIDHCKKPEMLAVNMKEYEQMCRNYGISMPPILELKTALKGSKSAPFLGIKAVHSCLTRKTVKCWCFDTSKVTKIT